MNLLALAKTVVDCLQPTKATGPFQQSQKPANGRQDLKGFQPHMIPICQTNRTTLAKTMPTSALYGAMPSIPSALPLSTNLLPRRSSVMLLRDSNSGQDRLLSAIIKHFNLFEPGASPKTITDQMWLPTPERQCPPTP